MLLALLGACGGSPAGPAPVTVPASVPVEPARARLLATLPDTGLDRGVWVLVPGDPAYPGSPLDALLPVQQGSLLVEAPGPVALLDGVPGTVEVGAPARRAGRTLVLAAPGEMETVLERLGPGGPSVGPGLRALAATRTPVAWTGVTGAGRVLVTAEADRLVITADRVDADAVRTALLGSLPGSPGRQWGDLLAGATVTERAGAVVLTARRTAAFPPTLLRQLVDAGDLPPR